MQELKEFYRRKANRARERLNENQRAEKSNQIKDKLFNIAEFISANTVMCYVDFKNEVKTKELIKSALEAGKKIALPIIEKLNQGNGQLIVSLVGNIDHGLEKNRFGIWEPKKEVMRLINPKEIDFAIIPGVAFDLHKHRIGYGKGYYDEFLKQVRTDCVKAGVCFEAQLYENIPYDRHDILMDIIVTENRIID